MMLYARTGFELTIEQKLKSTVNYIQSTVKYARRKVLYLFDINCKDECSRWCTVADCRSESESIPFQFSPPETIDDVPLPVDMEPPTHRKACWDVELEETQCLNGGSCFAVELHNGMRRSGCSCAPSWTGERCEMRYIDPSLWADGYDDTYRAASINVEMSFLIIFSFLLLSIGSLLFRHRRRRFLVRISTGSSVLLVNDDVIPSDIYAITSDCHVVTVNHHCVSPSLDDCTSKTFRGHTDTNRQEATAVHKVNRCFVLGKTVIFPFPVGRLLPVKEPPLATVQEHLIHQNYPDFNETSVPIIAHLEDDVIMT